ncbi:MAG: VanZ family protein [Coprococcus sp.]
MAEPARSGRRDCVSRQTKRCIKFGSFVLLILYIAVLIYVCFLSEDYGRDVVTSYYRYNFIPFKEIRRFYIYRDVVGIRAFLANLFGNVLAFMPYGFFMPILRSRLRRMVLYVAGMAFLLSLTIEITQLLTRVGSFDVDDLILNTSGGILRISSVLHNE